MKIHIDGLALHFKDNEKSSHVFKIIVMSLCTMIVLYCDRLLYLNVCAQIHDLLAELSY